VWYLIREVLQEGRDLADSNTRPCPSPWPPPPTQFGFRQSPGDLVPELTPLDRGLIGSDWTWMLKRKRSARSRS